MPQLQSKPTDYATHPWYNPKEVLGGHYGEAVQRLQQAFVSEGTDPDQLLRESEQMLTSYTPTGCNEQFGPGSGYSLAKEFYCDVIAMNAGVRARVLEKRGDIEQAKSFLLELYDACQANGLGRSAEFLCNRIDSRTFMPMRRHIDAAYLETIGYQHPERALMCPGDCQTIIVSEKIRDNLSLPEIDIAAYQHSLGSLIESPLGDLFNPEAYVFFCNAAADYALFGAWPGKREQVLAEMQKITDWLKLKRPRVAVFVTHVFFGIDKAIESAGTPEDAAMDSATDFANEVAAILSEAPNARLINFQEICPLVRDTTPFRDEPDSAAQLHFRFDIMDQVMERVLAALRGTGLH